MTISSLYCLLLIVAVVSIERTSAKSWKLESERRSSKRVYGNDDIFERTSREVLKSLSDKADTDAEHSGVKRLQVDSMKESKHLHASEKQKNKQELAKEVLHALEARQIYGPNLGAPRPAPPPAPSPVPSPSPSPSSGTRHRFGSPPSTHRLLAPILVQLMGGSSYAEGRVHVIQGGKTFAVCESGVDSNAARVICRMLGITTGSPAVLYGSSLGGPLIVPIEMDDVDCVGDELDLDQCRYTSVTSCKIPAVVNCYGVPVVTPPPPPVTPPPHPPSHHFTSLRLSGPSVIPHFNPQGRVEVQYQGQWKSVCDDLFDDFDATVVCRHYTNDYNMIGEVVKNAHSVFGLGRSDVWLDNLECYGTESDLNNCPHLGLGVHNCDGQIEVAGVKCRPGLFTPPGPAPPLPPLPQLNHIERVQLRGGQSSSPQEGLVEVYEGGQWHAICGHDLTQQVSEVICRYLGYTFVDEMHVYGPGVYGPGLHNIYPDELRCYGDEGDLSRCATVSRIGSCNGLTQAAGLSCSGPMIAPPPPPPPPPTPPPMPMIDDAFLLHPYGQTDQGWIVTISGGRMGTVCDDGFHQEDATVLCRMVNPGYTAGVREPNALALYGTSSVRNIHLSNLGCYGHETTVNDCYHDGINNVGGCTHSQDVGLHCY